MREIVWSAPLGLAKAAAPPRRYGIYRIHLTDVAGAVLPIARLSGVDADGVLYIGRSGLSTARTRRDIGKRLNEFLGAELHSGGDTYVQVAAVLGRINPRKEHRLLVSLCEFPDEEVLLAERRALRVYFETFAELPPLNCAFPGKVDAWRPESGCSEASE